MSVAEIGTPEPQPTSTTAHPDGNCFAHCRTISDPTFDRASMNSCATSFQP
jgi:hypothetical protein